MGTYIEVLKKYAVFTGRASRREFWVFAAVHFLIVAVLYGLAMIMMFTASGGDFPPMVAVLLGLMFV